MYTTLVFKKKIVAGWWVHHNKARNGGDTEDRYSAESDLCPCVCIDWAPVIQSHSIERYIDDTKENWWQC